MIKHTEEYAKAVVDDSRRQYVRSTFDLFDPDAQITDVITSSDGPNSKKEQVTIRGTGDTSSPVTTLETNRWVLDGSFVTAPPVDGEQYGWESSNMSVSVENTFQKFCDFPVDTYIKINVSDIEILQAMTMEFSDTEANGWPFDFVYSIYSGSNLMYSKEVTGNTERSFVLDGFTVNYPTSIMLTIKKWSHPNRRARVSRFLIGLHEIWDNKIIKTVDIYSEVTFSGLSIPYSTCGIEVYNEGHRFDPYAPNTIFTSIEDRQAITVELGMRLADGSIEWLPGGTYFQQSAGWKLHDLTVEWNLLDVIGMLTKKKFVVPSTLPTTVDGWLNAIMLSVGKNFSDWYVIDETIGAIALSATADDVKGKTCGELLRFICMATNTWPRQEMETGKLKVSKLEMESGNRITLDNMDKYATMSANDDIADITFKLDSNAEVTFPGNNTDSEVSLSVNNPFIHTTDDARKAVVSCLFEYGGRSFDVSSRGNPSSECGDIQAVDTQFMSTISARLYKQQLKLDKGVMQSVPSLLVQSPNDSMYENKVLLTGSGTWTAPISGTVKLTLIGGGNGGQGGGGGNILWNDFTDPDDTDGDIGGDGGFVFIIETEVVENNTYQFSCGAGGAGGKGGVSNRKRHGNPGEMGVPGTATTLGVFTSANGKTYQTGVMDIQSGAVYAQKGPDDGGRVSGLYGSGGAGGRHGRNGKYAQKKNKETGLYYTYIASSPTSGTDGHRGLDGCILIEW